MYPLIDNKVTFCVSLEILFCTVLSQLAKERQVKTKKNAMFFKFCIISSLCCT